MKSRHFIVIIILMGIMLLGNSCALIIEPVIYLIPAGYMGNVYIFHNVPDGEPLKREGLDRVYEISKDGILRSKSQEITGASISQYFYVTSNGKREKITGEWLFSIDDTPENRADNTPGIFYPQTGSISGGSVSKGTGASASMYNCEIKFEEFYVGTKQFLLSNHDLEKDLHAYVKEHPIC